MLGAFFVPFESILFLFKRTIRWRCKRKKEYYSGVKRREILTHATAWMNSEDIMLSETSRSLKDKYPLVL